MNKSLLNSIIVLLLLLNLFSASVIFQNNGKSDGEQKDKNNNNQNNGNQNGNNSEDDDKQFEKDQDRLTEESMSFENYKKRQGKTYSDSNQQKKRKEAFLNNQNKLKNAKCHPCGLNQFSDWTQDQLSGLFGHQTPNLPQTPAQTRLLQTVTYPTTYDWRAKGYIVTSVKNQKQCGSCWAFAATAFYESQYLRKNNQYGTYSSSNPLDLAEQYYVDCQSRLNGGHSYGCSGGWGSYAIQLGVKNGMPYEASFPYTASNYSYYPSTCTASVPRLKLAADTSTIQLKYYYNAYTKTTDSLIISYLMTRPVLIAVCANDFQYYNPTKTGVRMLTCNKAYSTSSSYLNHEVLLVGYTKTQWIIKNSWGTGWGYQYTGYVYVDRRSSYNCGIGYEVYSINSP